MPKNRKKKSKIFESKNQFFAILVRFLRSYGQTDVKIIFFVEFCSRYKFPEVGTTKNHENSSSGGRADGVRGGGGARGT